MEALEIIVVGHDVDRREALVAVLRRVGYRVLGVGRLTDAPDSRPFP
jgi:hypothetical protein